MPFTPQSLPVPEYAPLFETGHGLSRRDVARILGMDPHTVCKVATGQPARKASRQALACLLLALDAKVALGAPAASVVVTELDWAALGCPAECFPGGPKCMLGTYDRVLPGQALCIGRDGAEAKTECPRPYGGQ